MLDATCNAGDACDVNEAKTKDARYGAWRRKDDFSFIAAMLFDFGIIISSHLALVGSGPASVKMSR